ncbi:MAG: hypothetical protein ACLQUY_14060 [Ktedonobacterales bacterium]
MAYHVRSSGTTHRLLTASVVCCVLVLASCGQGRQVNAPKAMSTATLTALPLPTPTRSPHITTLPSLGTPITGPTPVWSQAALPPGFGMMFHQSDIAVAPSDGEVAYACATTTYQPSQPQVVVTHDGGVSWGPLTQINANFDGCGDATVDAMIPTTALLYDSPSPMGTGVLTRDGGSTWQAYNAPNAAVWSLATAGGSTYAILDSNSGGGESSSLALSRDGMGTWQPISVPYGPSGTDVLGFWGPIAGSMLAETGTNGSLNLWRSSDGGANWTGVPLPVQAVSWIEAAPGTRAGAWRIYVQYDDSTGFGQIAYSTDEGADWTVLPNLDPEGGGQLAGIGSDGAALATMSSNPVTLFRMAPGATHWQTLGALPQSAVWITYAPTPSGGILWAFPAESDGASGAGPANAVYSAPYPAD